MRKTINDLFGDSLTIDHAEGRLMLDARETKPSGETVGLLFDRDDARQLRDEINKFLGIEAVPQMSFGAGGNTVVIVNGEITPFSAEEAEALKKLVSGLLEK